MSAARSLALRLGLTEYHDAWDLQRRCVAARRADRIPDVLILLEHNHVYTLGRGGHNGNVLLDEARLSELGAQVIQVDRGGDVTYHGPGQVVGYPIVDLSRLGKDIHAHVWRIEELLSGLLAESGIRARRDPAYTGVWVGNDKIAAIGVRVARWISSHGFALNVAPDLSYFGQIIPCGIRGRGVTSIEALTGSRPARPDIDAAIFRHFERQFETQLDEIDRAALEQRLG